MDIICDRVQQEIQLAMKRLGMTTDEATGGCGSLDSP